jgi:hypothetical protein
MPTVKITCCKDCATRHPACHGTCEKYLQQRAEFDEWKEEQRKQDEIKKGLDAFRYDGISNICRNRIYRGKFRKGH